MSKPEVKVDANKPCKDNPGTHDGWVFTYSRNGNKIPPYFVDLGLEIPTLKRPETLVRWVHERLNEQQHQRFRPEIDLSRVAGVAINWLCIGRQHSAPPQTLPDVSRRIERVRSVYVAKDGAAVEDNIRPLGFDYNGYGSIRKSDRGVPVVERALKLPVFEAPGSLVPALGAIALNVSTERHPVFGITHGVEEIVFAGKLGLE